jgi:hypothetical protein
MLPRKEKPILARIRFKILARMGSRHAASFQHTSLPNDSIWRSFTVFSFIELICLPVPLFWHICFLAPLLSKLL